MQRSPERDKSHANRTGFDYSTPEAQEAMANVTTLVLEVREEYLPMMRRVRLYERTLGLAVIPVLIRRALIVMARRLNGDRSSGNR